MENTTAYTSPTAPSPGIISREHGVVDSVSKILALAVAYGDICDVLAGTKDPFERAELLQACRNLNRVIQVNGGVISNRHEQSMPA